MGNVRTSSETATRKLRRSRRLHIQLPDHRQNEWNLSSQKWNILISFGIFYLCNGFSIKRLLRLQRSGGTRRSVCATRTFLCYLVAKDIKSQNPFKSEQKSFVLTVRGAGCCGASWCGPRGGGGCLNSNSRCTNRFVRSRWLTPAAVSANDQAKLRRPGLMCGLRRVDRNHASVQPGRVGMGISPAHEADSFLCCHSAEWLLMAETAAASTPEPRAWHCLAPARHRKASTPYLP